MIKVGQTAEVIEIVNPDEYSLLYPKSSWGVIICYLTDDKSVRAFVGEPSGWSLGWLVRPHSYRKTGKLTITKIKGNGQ